MDKDSNMARTGFPSARISNLTTELLQGNYPTISTLGHTKKINTKACQEQFWTSREKAKRKQKEEAKKAKTPSVYYHWHIISAYSAPSSFVSRSSHRAKGNCCF
jgi:hypothetical protein